MYFERIDDDAAFVRSVDDVSIAVGHLSPIHDAHLVLPSKAVEGMARRKAVIHSMCEPIHTYYTKHGLSPAVCFYDNTVGGLAGVIADLHENKSKMKIVGENARKLVEQEHSHENVFHALNSALMNCIF